MSRFPLLGSLALPAFASLLCFLGGCASVGTVQDVSASSAIPNHLRDSAVVETRTTVPDSEAERGLLHALVVSGLEQNATFGHIISGRIDGSAASLRIRIDITQLNGVSDFARVMVGAFAGRASISATVVVSDCKTGAIFATFDVGGKSSAGTVFAGTTDQAVQKAAQQIVAELTNL
jgi:hypothetical protein